MSPHGTWARYNTGCRDECCRTAARNYQKRRLHERRHRVTSLGVRRRVQALAHLGWDMYAIARHVDTGRETIRQWTLHDTVYRSTHERMVQAYDELSMRLPPERTSREKANVARTRNKARRMGWAPPLAWDDIDDPNEVPQGVGWQPSPTAGRAFDHQARLAELRRLDDAEATIPEVCAQMEITRDALWKWCDRRGHLDLYERLARRSRVSENASTKRRDRRAA